MRSSLLRITVIALLALACGNESPSPRPCSTELLQRCQRIENGETPSEVLGTVKPDEMLVQLRACTSCGSFPRIENRIIPAAEDLQKVIDDVRRKQQ